MPPSYQVIVTGPRSEPSGIMPAGKWKRVIDETGAVSWLILSSSCQLLDEASTTVGWPRLKAMNAVKSWWQPMSPSTPLPKSHQERQVNGRYVGWYGRIGEGPTHRSQSR